MNGYKILLIFLGAVALSLLLQFSGNAILSPDEYGYGYGYNECELIAKNFQDEFGGNLVYIQPLSFSGAYDFGDYKGHWLNEKYISGNNAYIFFDYGNQLIFRNKAEITRWYKYQNGQDSEIFIMGKDNIPFPIIYHY